MNHDDNDSQVTDNVSIKTGLTHRSSRIVSNEPIVCIENGDSINIELVYYTAMLKKFAPNLSKEKDREKVIPWIRKLYAAEYATEFFKTKRNRYLFTMILSILNDEMYGVFKTPPPNGPLKAPESFAIPMMPPATWEMDTMLEELLKDEVTVIAVCSMHAECSREEEDSEEIITENMSEEEKQRIIDSNEKKKIQKSKKVMLRTLLDWEFQYLLHVARPYAALITSIPDKTKLIKWLQKLCNVNIETECLKMRGVRNDYMMALLGYLYDLRLTGPFENPPPDGPLETLNKAMDKIKDSFPLTIPSQNDVNEFLAGQPTPADGGAFCYIAISGDLQATNLIKSKPIQTNNCTK
ncbi:uncharacterized protein LOC126898286 [Daktulosphaira vitifoliae]|uniref:uncharacterized protein LOC126898286 n=1 Tax=Daktulosphaira vitifoliae TaxID=58002 RepID=UPI0021AA5454|nr:uncharacterized protein LOC126898286 [Daktulosphaira vitifoliae]